MQIFQRNILNKYIESLDISMIQDRYMRYSDYFLDPAIQENIHQSKEEQFQEGFLRELFVKILGYTLNPSPNYNLITEKKNEGNSKKADGAMLVERFDELDFKAFVAELKKQKISLSLAQQDEWEDYFNQYKADCNALSAQIAATDKEIDRMVYDLYGLSEDEIKVVEG